jgi:lipopolysaccharide/colanic/teichoic acid biosynthesis glycosyltransferase
MLKRLFDVTFSLTGLLVLSPLMIVIALRIKVGSPGPVLYRGRRVGRYGRPFDMLKFRTMAVEAAQRGGTSTPVDDPRITPEGRVLRAYKFDELPQLFNVLGGSMSFVGPRPQVQWAVDRYTADERKLISVPPGITDYASLKFSNEGEILRGAADPDQAYLELIAPSKIRLGLAYVQSHSLLEDLRIMLATIVVASGRPLPVWLLNLDAIEQRQM